MDILSNINSIIGDNCSIHETVKIGRNVTIHDNVTLKENVKIGDFSIIYPNVVIGEDSYIEAFCIIGEKQADFYKDSEYNNPVTNIGRNSLVRSNTIIYSGTDIGENFQTGHRVTIREEAKIGRNVRVGTLSDIQGKCKIGNYVNMHSNVHVGHCSVIEDYVWIFPYTILTNDPTPPSENLLGVTIKKYAVIATGTVVLPGVTVGEDALVGAQSLVNKDVSSQMVVTGNPAKEICPVGKIKSKITGEHVYPWKHYFDRGMPWEGVGFENWIKENA